MIKGTLKKKLTEIQLDLSNCIGDTEKTDAGNYSASSRLSRNLRDTEKKLKALRLKLRERRSSIKEVFDKTHSHRRGSNFGGAKENLFKKKK